ncbi:MAG: RNA chaperone Hfq [Blastocatellia bacterium]|nr:RNA chaperone Hfq [Blastocatellia bacterium]MCS7158293.1 RNA chaperone Hfq [Blastocatellia bacterium]MCX7753131.1 RNA chaperone Hfq [Blastocatellia bacterium]MDW8169446.1 RNA chaperone Hfq [Acidobacteriota bacterium]MDW8255720.1 RNA chaperone Hfq [Acidobacteriota bacterium]
MEQLEQATQDAFLNALRRDHVPVTVYLVSGIRLIGRIKGFDKYSILLDAGHQEMLIFKHAISTITRPKSELDAGSPGMRAPASE